MDVLPLGFRFSSRDEELIDHYLWSKIIGLEEAVGVIREIDIYNFEPWDLPDFSVIRTDDDEWFFFCPKDRKYQNGERMNRATAGGYWKATGKDRTIKSVGGKIVIGTKKCFVFYAGRAPLAQRTNWIMFEYSVASKELDDGIGQDSFILCKLIKKHDEKFGGNQDENSESSVGNEIEESASSSAPVGSFAEDMQSEIIRDAKMEDESLCWLMNKEVEMEKKDNKKHALWVREASTLVDSYETYALATMPPSDLTLPFYAFVDVEEKICK